MNVFAALIFALLGFGVVSWLLEGRGSKPSGPRPQQDPNNPFFGRGQQNRAHWPPRPAPANADLARYCQALGVKPPFTQAELQLAYRRKISEYHPDKVNNLGQDIQELALQKTVAINEAYEKLQAHTSS